AKTVGERCAHCCGIPPGWCDIGRLRKTSRDWNTKTKCRERYRRTNKPIGPPTAPGVSCCATGDDDDFALKRSCHEVFFQLVQSLLRLIIFTSFFCAPLSVMNGRMC